MHHTMTEDKKTWRTKRTVLLRFLLRDDKKQEVFKVTEEKKMENKKKVFSTKRKLE